jgi:hypothetical protein
VLIEMIPDRPGREADFEPLLDELIPIFCPGWDNKPAEPHSQHHRCEVKRKRIGDAASKNPAATRRHRELLLRAAVHDQCRSGIRQLIGPLTAALGYRPVQEAIIGYIRTGSDAEKVGATMAWYFAQPGRTYSDRGILAKERRTALDALADLRDQYRAACLAAFLACPDPQSRQDLSLGFDLDPAAYSADLLPSLDQARQIINADPSRYRRILG